MTLSATGDAETPAGGSVCMRCNQKLVVSGGANNLPRGPSGIARQEGTEVGVRSGTVASKSWKGISSEPGDGSN